MGIVKPGLIEVALYTLLAELIKHVDLELKMYPLSELLG